MSNAPAATNPPDPIKPSAQGSPLAKYRQALWLFAVLPVIPTYLAVYILNRLIPCDLISTGFSFTVGKASSLSSVPASMADGLYRYGMSAVGLFVLAAICCAVAGRIIIRLPLGRARSGIVLASLVLGIGGLLVIGSGLRGPDNCISARIMFATLDALVKDPDIGSVTDSVRGIRNWALGSLLMAAVLVAIAAMAVLQSHHQAIDAAADINMREEKLGNLMVAAAATLIVAILMVHFYFALGAALVDANPLGAAQKLHAADQKRFASLSMAMEIYWGTIASVMLAAIYLPTAGVLWAQKRYYGIETSKANPIHTASLKTAQLLSPLLAGAVLQGITAVINQATGQ